MSAPAAAKILVVDDTPMNVKLLVDILSARGYAVRAATNGEEALARVAEEAPDLILMDIHLPGISGVDALKLLRADTATARIPIAAVTASVMQQDRAIIMDAGFDAYVSKPISLKEFLDTVRALLERGPR